MSIKSIYPVWLFTVKNGHMEFDDKEGYDLYINTHFEGKIGEIVAKPQRKARSKGGEGEGNQNGYYWAVIVRIIAEHMGFFDYEADNFLKDLFLRKGRTAKNGKRYQIVGEHKDLSTVEFEEYCANCRMWASKELSVYIPEPNEAEWPD